MLNDSCNCCDSKRLVKCKGSSHGILGLDRKLSLTCCAHKGCTIFRWLNDFHIKTSFFVVAFCLCYIKSSVVGIRCPVQAECDFLLCTIFCVYTCRNCKHHSCRCNWCDYFFQILIHDFSPFLPAAMAL